MRVLVNEMPKKKEECLFYRRIFHSYNGFTMNSSTDCCDINNKPCSFKNGESIFGAKCRCLEVGLHK